MIVDPRSMNRIACALVSLLSAGCTSQPAVPDSGRTGHDAGSGICQGAVAVASYPDADYFTGAWRDATCTAASFSAEGEYGDIGVEGGPLICGTAYLARDLGSPRSAPYRASVRLGMGASQSPGAPFTAFQVLDDSGAVLFRLWTDPSRGLHLSSAAGALDTSAIDVDLEVALPNDGTEAIEVQVDVNTAGMLTVTAGSSIVLSQHVGRSPSVRSFQVGVIGFQPATSQRIDLLESFASLVPIESGLDGGTPDADGGPTMEMDAASAIDAGQDGGTRAVTNPQVVFDGTEIDLTTQYWRFVEDPGGSVAVVDDPLGHLGSVLRFREQKIHTDWQHVMVAAQDKRDGYASVAVIDRYGPVYHTRQKVFLRGDAQYASETDMGVFDIDYHCEPCQANNLGVAIGVDGPGSVCLTVLYSTDPTFDPRGPTRGGTTNPWTTITANRFMVPVLSNGTPQLPPSLPPTGQLNFCRQDLHIGDLTDRWVEIEFLVRPSSYGTGVIRLWIDGRPYFYEGANDYRWNELGVSGPARPVAVFQWGLYLPSFTPAAGTPAFWELFTTPPRIEIGDEIVYRP